jgi:hypothetical protein
MLSVTNRLRFVPETIRREWETLLHSETARKLQSLLRPIPALELEDVRLAKAAGVVLLAATDVDGRFYRRADLDRLLAGVAGLNQPAENGE